MYQMLVNMTLEGLKMTIGVFIITLVVSIPLSVPVALMRLSKNKISSTIMAVYIYIMRGTPLLLQLMFVFFGLPYLGLTLGRFESILFAYILNYTAYFAEIFRGGILSIDKGQYEAGQVLGMSRSYTFLKVVLPQVVRTVMPSVGNEVITLLKDTSLVYILGVSDILKAAKSVSNTYSTFTPYVYIGLVYLAFTAVLTHVINKVEKKYDYLRK